MLCKTFSYLFRSVLAVLPLHVAQTSGSLSCPRSSPWETLSTPACTISDTPMTLTCPLLLSPRRPFWTPPPGCPASISNAASGKENESAVCRLQSHTYLSYFGGGHAVHLLAHSRTLGVTLLSSSPSLPSSDWSPHPSACISKYASVGFRSSRSTATTRVLAVIFPLR